MKKIGFIDYHLDEYHSNNYPAWIRRLSDERYNVHMAYGDDERDGLLGNREWCEKMQIQFTSSIQDVIDASDCLVVLSPNNPEQHMRLTELPLRSGKPVYVDKTFACNYADAKQMLNLAKAHDTPVYSTSALRYAPEIVALDQGIFNRDTVCSVKTIGPGNFDTYSIHQIEMIVCLMDGEPILCTKKEENGQTVIEYQFDNGNTAQMQHVENAPFSIEVTTHDGQLIQKTISFDFWDAFILNLIEFFDTGVPSVDPVQTLRAMKMYEMGQ